MPNLEIDVFPDGRMDMANTAKYIGISRAHLYRLRTQGRGPRRYIQQGRKIFYFKKDVDEWLQAGSKRLSSTAP